MDLALLVILAVVVSFIFDLNLRFPVFTVHRHQEILKIIHHCCILRHVPLIKALIQIFNRKMLLYELIDGLILLKKRCNLISDFVAFLFVLANRALYLRQQRRGQIADQHAFDTLVHEFENDLQAVINLLACFEQNLLVDRVVCQLAQRFALLAFFLALAVFLS